MGEFYSWSLLQWTTARRMCIWVEGEAFGTAFITVHLFHCLKCFTKCAFIHQQSNPVKRKIFMCTADQFFLFMFSLVRWLSLIYNHSNDILELDVKGVQQWMGLGPKVLSWAGVSFGEFPFPLPPQWCPPPPAALVGDTYGFRACLYLFLWEGCNGRGNKLKSAPELFFACGRM